MKTIFKASIALLAGSALLSSCSDKQALKLESNADSISYAQGLLVGSQYKKWLESEKVKGNQEAFFEAFKLAIQDDSSAFFMTKEEAFNVIQEYNQRLTDEAMEKMEQQKREIRAINKVKSDEFIAKYKDEYGVIPTESGLLYRIQKEGFGPKPTLKDTVILHCEGKLFDGKTFINSYKQGEPVKAVLNDIAIAGWKQILQEMPKGSVWEVVIPSELAYGEKGAQDVIPGNAALKCKIELVNVINPKGKR